MAYEDLDLPDEEIEELNKWLEYNRTNPIKALRAKPSQIIIFIIGMMFVYLAGEYMAKHIPAMRAHQNIKINTEVNK